jgi:hypothetical protein
MKTALTGVALLALVGCSSAPETPATPPPAAKTEPAPVPNHTSLFDDAGKISASVVPDHILGMQTLPGGSFAEYGVKGTKYQEFIVDTSSNSQAADELVDMKHEMAKDPAPEYLPHIGGYFGTYQGKPLYVFAKLHYLAGVVGLPQDKADPLAIKLAANLY